MSRSRKLRTKFIASPTYRESKLTLDKRQNVASRRLLSVRTHAAGFAAFATGIYQGYRKRLTVNGNGAQSATFRGRGTNFPCLRWHHAHPTPSPFPSPSSSSSSSSNEKVELLRPQIDKPRRKRVSTNPRRNTEERPRRK